MGETGLIEWDDLKNERNIALRLIDFAGLEPAFDGRHALVREDRRRDYGERRFNMIVDVEGLIFNITFTPRGRRRRIISARLASRQERRLYRAQRQDD